MRKAKATYYAPEGDSEVVTMGAPNDPNAIRFFDGQSVDLNTDDNGALIEKLKDNPHFDIEIGEEEVQPEPKRKPGRPKKADKDGVQKEELRKDENGEPMKENPVEPGPGFQGGPSPGGKATGIPGQPPLQTTDEDGNQIVR